jgi:hypothetical protein
MPRRVLNKLLLALIALLFLRCDGGLTSPEPETGVTGFTVKITFLGTWPQGVKRTHLMVFKNPVTTADNFSISNLGVISDSIAYGSSVYNFNSINNVSVIYFQAVPGTYPYVVVAQSKTENLSFDRKDWTIAGVYYSGTGTSTPGVLTIEKDKMTKEINITCDFNNPPPQPPGGE